MPRPALLADNNNLERKSRRNFSGKTTWPPDRASLTALVDLGLTDDCIASYFKVARPDATALRRAYNLNRPQMSS